MGRQGGDGGVRTVELEELVVAGLRGQLLGVDDSRLESFALGSHCEWIAGWGIAGWMVFL